MHADLDRTWHQVERVLKPGGFACINIGDATRKLGDEFCLYPNHARILQTLTMLGFSVLPDILWRKQANSPTKFMGSGMLPAGAYVTLEHEYILIVRKGAKRIFDREAEREGRRQSAFFWEERNEWFSDVWTDLKGTSQRLQKRAARSRSGAFPFELAYRLINMYSVKGDRVLDPFAGTGTTMAAAMAAGRSSTSMEIDASFLPTIKAVVDGVVQFSNRRIDQRLKDHLHFVANRTAQGKPLKYVNRFYGFPVVTNQERSLLLDPLEAVDCKGELSWEVDYGREARADFQTKGDVADSLSPLDSAKDNVRKKQGQMKLF
jgi:DNA modification methylase